MSDATSSHALVVGASGQLGAALLRQLGPAALPAGRRGLASNWLRLDLEEITADPSLLDSVFAAHNITSVYCAAGATDVESCESQPLRAAAANHLGPLALANRARHIPFVFFSTDYVFDGRAAPGSPAGPYTEAAAPNPLSVYGRTKFAGERAILDAHPTALVLRTTTVYGPDPQHKNFLYTLNRLLREGRTMRVPEDQFATPTYNEDLAAAAVALVVARHNGLVHVGGPEFLSRSAFAFQAARLLDLDDSLIQPVITANLHQKAERPLLGGLRSEKLIAILGPGIMRSPDAGIRTWLAAHCAAQSEAQP